MGKLTVNADAQPHSVVFTAARAATVDRSVPRRYAGAMLNPYLPCRMHLGSDRPFAEHCCDLTTMLLHHGQHNTRSIVSCF